MCKDQTIRTGIKKLDFSTLKGKFKAYLSDGRELTIPISLFPEIKKLSLKKRDEWMVLDDQFFTFAGISKIYSISDLLRV